MGAEHSRWVPDGWVDRYALVGSASEVLARIIEMVDEGIDEVSIAPFATRRREAVNAFAEGVIARSSESSGFEGGRKSVM
jgi:hypothetical protein